MMRKMLILVAILMLSLTVTKAQDKATQSPIIAIRDGKMYAISPDDGSATLVVKPSEADRISRLKAGSIAPNGQWMAYVVENASGPSDPSYSAELRLLYMSDLLTDDITPRGGVFDRPVPKNHIFQLEHPTWSVDGTRLYYVRTERETRGQGNAVDVQLGYYDPVARSHHLVARLDPTSLLENLQAVPEGMIVRWYAPGFTSTTTMSLYNANNQIVKQVEMDIPYLHALRDKDSLYYAQLKDFGDIDFTVNANTGEKQTFESGYYPAEQSLINGDQSMHVFSLQSDINTYYVYGADYDTLITSVNNTSGFSYAISPDGQYLAYIIHDQGPNAPIQIMDMKGNVHQLDFEARQILWGATEFVPFFAPG